MVSRPKILKMTPLIRNWKYPLRKKMTHFVGSTLTANVFFWPFDNVQSKWHCVWALVIMNVAQILTLCKKKSVITQILLVLLAMCKSIENCCYKTSVQVWPKVGKWILASHWEMFDQQKVEQRNWTATLSTHTSNITTHNFKSNEEKVFILHFISFLLQNADFVL